MSLDELALLLSKADYSWERAVSSNPFVQWRINVSWTVEYWILYIFFLNSLGLWKAVKLSKIVLQNRVKFWKEIGQNV